MTFNVTDSLGGGAVLFALMSLLLTAIVHIAFALAVFQDASRIASAGIEPTFVSPAIWALATLLGGVLSAALYWAIHHSTLRREPSPGD